MPESLVFVPAGLLLACLLLFEHRKERSRVLIPKALLSCLFVVAALIRPHPRPGYAYLVLAGLTLCLAGDVFLALDSAAAFFRGLVAFLLGHLFYIAAFFVLAQTNAWTWAGAVAGTVAAAAVYRWLRPHLGSMDRAVLVYIGAITAMLTGAFSVAGDAGLAGGLRVLVLSGALCFYLSDIFVARDRFLRPGFLNRLIGLPLYYAGQFQIAFSVGLVAAS